MIGELNDNKKDGFKTCFAIGSLLICIVSGGFNTKAIFAYSNIHDYNCSGNHCYNVVRWTSTYDTEYFGYYNSETSVGIGCVNCDYNSGFISNESWIADPGSPTCPCWVEAGYTTDTPGTSTNTVYFWADKRPALGYYEHQLGSMPSSDFNRVGYYSIVFQGNGIWAVSVNTPGAYYSGNSTNNFMHATNIETGSELYGTNGANSNTVHFTSNQWMDVSRTIYFQTTDGSLRNDSPPYGGWLTPPSSSSTGGNYYTYCC